MSRKRTVPKTSYLVIKCNNLTKEPSQVVSVMATLFMAERILERCEMRITGAEQKAGWAYFIEPSRMPPGLDPALATEMRAMEASARKAKASQAQPRTFAAQASTY